MSKVISTTSYPQNCVICFGRLPKWISYMLPESNVYQGWNQDSKKCASELAYDTYIVTDNPQASGVQALLKRFPKFMLTTYDKLIDGSLYYEVLNMNRYLNLYVNKISNIVGIASHVLQKKFGYPHVQDGLPYKVEYTDGNIYCQIVFSIWDDTNEFAILVRNLDTGKDAVGKGDLRKDDQDFLTPSEFINQFTYLYPNLISEVK